MTSDSDSSKGRFAGLQLRVQRTPIRHYNVNADTVAAELAIALKATKLVLLTDVEGVRGADGELISALDAATADGLIQSGVIHGGMIPKVRAALRALDAVTASHIIDGRVSHSLLLELLTEKGVGTMVTR